MNLRTIRLGMKVAPCIASAMVFWLVRYSHHPEKYTLEKRYKKVRKLCRKIIDHLELDVKFINYEFLNNQEKCFLGLSNHRHYIDPLLYIYFSEKPIAFVSKKENERLPFVKHVMKAIDCLFIDRDDIMSQVRVFKTMADRIKNNQMSYFVFPEGTRLKNKKQIHTLPYKDGSIKPAYWANCDIIPCASYGSDLMLDKKNPTLKKRNITLKALAPYRYNDFKDKPTTLVMPEIEEKTNQLLNDAVRDYLNRNVRRIK